MRVLDSQEERDCGETKSIQMREKLIHINPFIFILNTNKMLGEKKFTADGVCALWWPALGDQVIAYDAEYDAEVSKYKWFVTNGYAYNHKAGYMHKLVADLVGIAANSAGSATDLSINHINVYKLDNRAKNLRMATQSEQNSNRHTRADKKPPCEELQALGITELPKHVRWDKTEKKFIIEKHPALLDEVQRGIRKKACMSGSKSVALTILQKYQDILSRLDELNAQLPDDAAVAEFQALKAANKHEYERICANFLDISIPTTPLAPPQPAIEPMRRTAKGRKTAVNFPEGCDISPEDIPKYCWYRAAKGNRSDAFIIDNHPCGIKHWSTTGSSKVSTKAKFLELIDKLEEVGVIDPFEDSDEM